MQILQTASTRTSTAIEAASEIGALTVSAGAGFARLAGEPNTVTLLQLAIPEGFVAKGNVWMLAERASNAATGYVYWVPSPDLDPYVVDEPLGSIRRFVDALRRRSLPRRSPELSRAASELAERTRTASFDNASADDIGTWAERLGDDLARHND
jgi:hypothetical protein